MGIVYRNGRAYLYRSVRRGGKVTSRYIASGEAALLVGRMDQLDRLDRDDARRASREERRAAVERDARLDDAAKQAEALARDALERAGFHQHRRGEWRRRRVRPACGDQREGVAPGRHDAGTPAPG